MFHSGVHRLRRRACNVVGFARRSHQKLFGFMCDAFLDMALPRCPIARPALRRAED
jgi:hypothetical protein